MSVATKARTGLEIRKVHPHIGAEVSGVDLGAPLRGDIFARIRDAFHAHSVLVFRNQNITDGQQVAFSARFGELERTTSDAATGEFAFGGILVFDPVAVVAYTALDSSGWRREGYDITSVPLSDDQVQRYISSAYLTRGK